MPSTSKGRPQVSFNEGSDKTKRRRVNALVASKSPIEIQRAASLIEKKNGSGVLSIPKALSLYYGMQLSVRKYNMMRSAVNSIHEECFPSYYALKQARSKLLPSPIVVTESSAEVPLQNLLNKTVSSLLNICNVTENAKLIMDCKWGLDGSSGHSTYKQKFSAENATDEFLVVCAFVPLRIIDAESENELWVNEKFSSPLFCRPIRFIFSKENPELVRDLENKIRKEIDELSTFFLRKRTFKH